MLAYHRGQLIAVCIRHVEIHEYEVGFESVKGVEHLQRLGDRQGLHALFLKYGRRELGLGDIVLYHQNTVLPLLPLGQFPKLLGQGS